MITDVLFMRCQTKCLLKTSSGTLQVASLHQDYTEVMLTLYMIRLKKQNPEIKYICIFFEVQNVVSPFIAVLSHVQVPLMVCVDVTKEDETLDVVWKVVKKLLQWLKSF